MQETSAEWQRLHLRVHLLVACAVVNLQALPDKLNPLVRPLMEGVKREENALVQGYAASFLAKLLQQCAARQPCPNTKIIKNLCSSACADPAVTPSSSCPVPPPPEALKGEPAVPSRELGHLSSLELMIFFFKENPTLKFFFVSYFRVAFVLFVWGTTLSKFLSTCVV